MKKSTLFTSYLLPATLLEALFRGWSAFILFLGLFASMNGDSLKSITCITIALSAVLIIVTRKNRAKTLTVENPNIDLICFMVIVTLSLLCYLWVLKFDSVQVSDFGVYFRCGTEKHSNISAWITSCQSKYLNENLIYWSRSLLYSIPFGIFSGADYDAFKIYNASLHVATIVTWFLGLRYYFGSRIAITATLILTVYPEWWFTTTLVTSDNSAIFFIVAFLLLLPQIERRSYGWLTVTALAFTIFAANQLRTIGPMLAATLIFWVILAQLSKPNFATIVRGLTVLGLYFVLNFILRQLTPFSSPDPIQFLKYLSAVDFSSAQDFDTNYQWFEHFWSAIPPESKNTVGWSKVLLEFSWGFDKLPSYLYKKAAIFFSGTGYYFFSSFPFGLNPDTVFTVPKNTIPFIPSTFSWMKMAVTFCAALSLFSLIKIKLNGPALAAVLWLSAFTLMVLGLGEVQPRYSVLIAPALSLLAAQALFSSQTKENTVVSQPIDVKIPSIVFVALLMATVFGIIVMGLSVWHSVNATPNQNAKNFPNSLCDSRLARIEKSYKRVRVILPTGASCAAISIPVNLSKKSVTFFVSGTRFPFPFEPKVLSPFHYSLLAQEQTLLESSLEFDSTKWHRIDFPKLGTINELLLIVRRQDITNENVLDFWFF